MALMIFVSIVAVFLAWCLWRKAQNRLSYDMWRIPGPKPLPLIGNVGAVIGSSYVHKIFAEWTSQYGPIFKWSIAGMEMLVITDPLEVGKLTSRELNLPKAQKLYKLLGNRPPHYNILATSDHEEWKYLRRMTGVAFSPENIRKAYPKIYDAACRATRVLSKMSLSGHVEMDSLASRITAEVINVTGFDQDTGSLEYTVQDDGTVQLSSQPFLQHIKVLSDIITMAFTNPVYAVGLALCPWHPTAKRNKAAISAIDQKDDETAASIIKRGPQPETDTSLWACLSRLENHKDGGPIHPTALAVNASIFFAAGYETSGHAVSWALFELAANSEVQARVRKELEEAGLTASPDGKPPRPLEYADLTKLKQLDAVIKETLRLHSTAPLGSTRQADRDMVIMGYRIPKGTIIMLCPHPLHVSPHNFTHPHRFWPERWLSDDLPGPDTTNPKYPDATPKGNRQSINGSWLPFSSGPKNCIGQNLAMAELRTTLAVFLGNFYFELPNGVQRERFISEEEVWWVTMQAKSGVHLKVRAIRQGA